MSSSNMSTMTTVAAVAQMTVTSDIDHNLQQAGQLVHQARQRGASMVFLPEACDYIGDNRQQTLSLAQTVDGSTVEKFRNMLTINFYN